MIADDQKFDIINKKLFKLADQDENGYICRVEFANFMNELWKEYGCDFICGKILKCDKKCEICKGK